MMSERYVCSGGDAGSDIVQMNNGTWNQHKWIPCTATIGLIEYRIEPYWWADWDGVHTYPKYYCLKHDPRWNDPNSDETTHQYGPT